MATTNQMVREFERILLGWQCPECFGVRIEARQTRFDPKPTGYLCSECGCQFSPPIKTGARSAKKTSAA